MSCRKPQSHIISAQTLIWRQVKSALIARYGGIAAAARELQCSVRGLRAAAEGTCPGILDKMKNAGLFATSDGAVEESNSR
jgi:hypothetical protein